MSLLKGLLNETRKVNEEDLFSGPGMGSDAPVAPAEEFASEEEAPVDDGECAECPEITDELVAELAESNPAISEVDPTEFKSGLECEIGCLEAVGGDLNVVASIVLCKLNKFPGKDYFGALKTMEASLNEPEVEAPVEGEEPAIEEEVAASAELGDDQPAEMEEGKEGVGDNPTTDKAQPDNKALSQVKNENKTSGPGTAGVVKDEKKTWSKEKGQEDAHKAADKTSMNAKDKNTGAGVKEAAAAEVAKDEKEEKATAAKEKAQEVELKKKQAADDKVKNKA